MGNADFDSLKTEFNSVLERLSRTVDLDEKLTLLTGMAGLVDLIDRYTSVLRADAQQYVQHLEKLESESKSESDTTNH